MKKLLFLLLLTNFCFAQNLTRTFVAIAQNTNGFEVEVSDGIYNFKFINDKIVENSFIPKGQTSEIPSHAVILETKNKNLTFLAENNTITIFPSFGKLKVQIQKKPFKISYLNNDKEILSEKNGFTKINDSTETVNFNISTEEKLYGGGARVLGMNRRGNRLQLYNRAHYGYETRSELMNFCIPLVLSSKIYAVHFDNQSIGYLDLDSKKNNTITYETISGRKTYQVIVGDSWENLIQNYTDLTGKQPLPPRWVFGNFSSRFGYHSQEEVEKTIQKFEDEKIPVDAIILDLYWFGKEIKGTMGNLEWDKDNFPNPKKMISDLKNKGVKTVLITEPFILTTSSKWSEAVSKKVLATNKSGKPFTYDFYFGNTGIVDIFNPDGKKWFWNIYKNLTDQGVAGLWGDLGEPEVFPSQALTVGGKADDVHNIYGHNWAKLISDGYKTDFPNKRPFILMRSGYSGSQRFGMIPWSGDVNRTWGGFSGQTEISLQMGMQGMSYMHSDLGGFAGANLDDELYVRWLQYGVFNPIFRPHAQEDVASEPIFRSDKAKKLAKEAIELRYKLLPYNYTIAFQNSETGKPLMRPLFFDEPENEILQTKADEYLWGQDFLIAPVTEKGQTEKQIYFPKNSNWYNFYTKEKFNAGTTATVKLNENNIPTFVRGNVFIPMTKLVQTTEKYNNSYLDLHFYFDGKESSEREFYFDDGTTANAEKNDNLHEILNCTTQYSSNLFSIQLESKTNSKVLLTAGKKGTIFLYNFNKKPKSILINGKKVAFKFNSKLKTLTIDYAHFAKTIINVSL